MKADKVFSVLVILYRVFLFFFFFNLLSPVYYEGYNSRTTRWKKYIGQVLGDGAERPCPLQVPAVGAPGCSTTWKLWFLLFGAKVSKVCFDNKWRHLYFAPN